MSVAELLRSLATWCGLSRATTIDILGVVVALIAAIGTLAAVVVSLLTASGARRDTRRANTRLLTYQVARDGEDRQRRADERALEAAYGEAGAAFVRVSAEWTDTPSNFYWKFTWHVSGRAEMTLLSAFTQPPCVRSANDQSPVDLLAVREQPGQEFLSTRDVHGSVRTGGRAQCYLLKEPNLSEPPRIVIQFRDRQRNVWQLDTDSTLTLLNPRVIQAMAAPPALPTVSP